jgi:hypothetical protein
MKGLDLMSVIGWKPIELEGGRETDGEMFILECIISNTLDLATAPIQPKQPRAAIVSAAPIASANVCIIGSSAGNETTNELTTAVQDRFREEWSAGSSFHAFILVFDS